MSIYVFPTDIVGAIGIASIPHVCGGNPFVMLLCFWYCVFSIHMPG